jgi:YVTN family beta-propeller protein
VSNYESGTVSALYGNTNTVTANITVGYGVGGVASVSSNGYVYAIDSNIGSDTASVINGFTNKVVATISGIGPDPVNAASDPANRYVYFINNYGITAIDENTNAIVGKISQLGSNSALAYDSTNGYMYLASSNYNNVFVIDGLGVLPT